MNFVFPWPLHCNPWIHVAGRFPFSPAIMERGYQGPTVAIHQHFYRGVQCIGRRRFNLIPGDITITPPEFLSRFELEEAGYHWCLHFNDRENKRERRSKFVVHLPLHLRPIGWSELATERMQTIIGLFESASSGAKINRETARACGSTLLQSMLLKIALEARKPVQKKMNRRRSDAALDGVLQRIDQEFHQKLEVEDLARESGLSRNYFAARFQERFGHTVQHYLLNRRIGLARNLLLSTGLSIKEVAYECGIRDPHYFNKQFRRITGVSPTQYRAKGGIG